MVDHLKLMEYKLRQTKGMPNLKEAAGRTLNVVRYALTQYTDKDGEIHDVLSIQTDAGEMFRTEGRAFMDSFNNFWSVFGEEEAKPAIKITECKSARRNPYLDLEIVE